MIEKTTTTWRTELNGAVTVDTGILEYKAVRGGVVLKKHRTNDEDWSYEISRDDYRERSYLRLSESELAALKVLIKMMEGEE